MRPQRRSERADAGAAQSAGRASPFWSGYPPIADYAVIGDCRTAALVSASGAVEWLCLPSFSSPSVFAAILDRARGGAFTIRPEAPFSVERAYLADTAILETTFTTDTGRLRLRDFMAVEDGGRWTLGLRPHRELVRLVECLEGEVALIVCVEPRPDYGRAAACGRWRAGFGWVFDLPRAALVVASEIQLAPEAGGARLSARTALVAGETRTVALGFEEHEIAVRPACGALAWQAYDATARWWRDWTAACTYEGEYRDLVVRSAITLKLLTYSLSGAIVAAATTSLPEAIGGGRNFDYRFCWLRDAAITMRAFLGLGFLGEGEAFVGWMLNATRLTRKELRIL